MRHVKKARHAHDRHVARKRRTTARPTLIVGETAPDERNANVTQSELGDPTSEDPWGDQQLYGKNRAPRTGYAAEEIGDADERSPLDAENPQGVQGGRGPLAQEGEGNRQNDEFSELEQEPEEH
jgi:hypothetical protein